MVPTLVRTGAALVLAGIAAQMFGPTVVRALARSHRRIVRKAVKAKPLFWHLDAEATAWRGWGLAMLVFAVLCAGADILSDGGRAGEPLRTLLIIPLCVCLLGFIYVSAVFICVRLNREAGLGRRRTKIPRPRARPK